MDVQMPEMDGPTATKRIRALGGAKSEVPIIALTANAMKGDRERYLVSGMSDYISKPINQRALHDAIWRSVGESRPEPTVTGPATPVVPPTTGNAAAERTGGPAEILGDLLDELDGLIDETRDS